MQRVRVFSLGILVLFASLASAAGATQFTRTEDVIYGRKFGTALTLDVFKPETANGAAVLYLMSGGWASNYGTPNARSFEAFLARGYTVFTVWHGSQPKYVVPEIMDDIQRAARYVRTHAKRFGIDPQRIGVTGTSSGGHLSLLLAVLGGPGKPDAKDPIDRASSAVQAAAVFCPPTDFANWTQAGDNRMIVNPVPAQYAGAWLPRGATQEGREALWREWSPIRFVKAGVPPVFIIHGDVDRTVPLFQANTFAAAVKAAGGTTEVVVRVGKDHTWPEMVADRAQFADWFDRHLLAKAK